MTRIRTLEFLPSIFQTETNSQFLAATLDQLVNPPVTKTIQGYVGSKFGYGIDAKDYYVTEPNKVRRDYQLEPGVVFLKDNETTAKDFISYPGIINSLELQGSITTNNNDLFKNQFYSWDSFTNLDMIINYNQYYWLPDGPPAVTVAASTVFTTNDYVVTPLPSAYNIRAVGAGAGTNNPTITLLRGGTYNFIVDQDTQFWIQGEPGVTGFSPVQQNLYTRDIYGVSNNGASQGVVNFQVPQKDAQNEFNYPGDNVVGVISTLPFSQVNGARLSSIGSIDGVTSLNGRTVMFYNTGVLDEIGYVGGFYDRSSYDENIVSRSYPTGYNGIKTITATNISVFGEITVSSTENLVTVDPATGNVIPFIGSTLTFSGTSFGDIQPYDPDTIDSINASNMVVGKKYFISALGDTDWIDAGVVNNAVLDAEIVGTELRVYNTVTGAFSIGNTLNGAGVTNGTKIIGYDFIASHDNGVPTYTVDIDQNVARDNINVYAIQLGKIFTCSNVPALTTGSVVEYDPTIYYIKSVDTVNNKITISETLDGPVFLPSLESSGNMTAFINQGQYEEGFYTKVNDYFYTIFFTGDPNDPIITLNQSGLIPIEQKITPQYGTDYVGLHFIKNSAGYIEQLPYISAPLDTLYYQDGTNPNRVGVIKLIENNETNVIDVINDILGKINYTAKNGVAFTNGLKVVFDGDVIPRSYLQGEYYVEGVGTGIELIPVESLIVPEPFTTITSNPYDILPFDDGPYDAGLNIPTTPDYVTIARNSINKNAWTRSNRWFHIDVINSTAEYNDNPEIADEFARPENKAKRPILEFYPNLKLFNSGIIGKAGVDYIDRRTVNAFDTVEAQQNYYPDVETYTAYQGTINANDTVVGLSSFLEDQFYQITDLGTTEVTTWESLGAESEQDGAFEISIQYVITSDPLTDGTDWNEIAGTTDISATSIQIGVEYIITDVGTTDFTLIGAASNTIGVVFVATGIGTGTGKVSVVYDTGDIIVAEHPGSGTGTGTALKTLFKATEAGVVNSETLQAGKDYTIVTLGTTQWQLIGNTLVNSDLLTVSEEYFIFSLGTTDWNAVVGTTDITYKVGDKIVVASTALGTGMCMPLEFTATGPAIGTGTAIQGTGEALPKTVTTISIDTQYVNGTFSQGQWINDLILSEESRLPAGTRILSVHNTNPYLITVYWPIPGDITSGSLASFVACSTNNADQLLFPGARIVFAADENELVRNKIYNVNFNTTGAESYPVITLTEAEDGLVVEDDMFSVDRGFNNKGKTFYFDGIDYIQAQQKQTVNQAPLFDIFDENGISYGDQTVYNSSSFDGCKLFNYKIGVGVNDSVLGFPISFSSINNVGDISFEVSLYTQTFDYIDNGNSLTSYVNNGFVYDYSNRETYERLIGWQTAVAPSTQYQVFQFDYEANIPALVLDADETIDFTFVVDVAQLDREDTIWPSLQVFNNNNILELDTDYTVENTSNSTIITVKLSEDVSTPIQVIILSNKTSANSYYTIPINLSNNPFNSNPDNVDIGDIRGHYQSIYENNPDTTGIMFGPNNYRDLGNLVPWGNRIIQNSASLVLPGAFLRDPQHNLYDALLFNSREYIKFKTLLVDTINKLNPNQKYDPAIILDEAIDVIASVKSQEQPFFWSDMIPNKAPYITNIYSFANQAETSVFPLSKIYDFSTANYEGVLIYLQRKISGVLVTKQLFKDSQYTISTDSPSVNINIFLESGDKIIIKEYNQTYGSYIPNTPTKLGLYPLFVPQVLLDTTYVEPTYFIQGHDGSYNKLYGDYNAELGMLVDFRDQALFEYETRVYNNIKLSNPVPIDVAEFVPGYFRDTALTYAGWTEVYSKNFLDWIGQNRLDYKTQLYRNNDPWSYNYRGQSTFKLDNSLILQGYWRGIYEYLYDTSTPNLTPWAMIGYSIKPSWWEDRYGPAPYTSDNLVLWTDLQDGLDYNDGVPVVRELYKRPGLLEIIPVDDQGNLKEPLDTVIANYNALTFQRDWIVGDDAPVEYSYRKSSTYPFDLMRLEALLKPAVFYNLGADVDNYKYNSEFNQFLVNGRTHLVPADIQIYGNGIAKTSYINWIVDYEKQLGVDATTNIKNLLNNLDVRLVYRLAGFSDKSLLKFFVEKGTPESRNSSLLIPDESYQVLLYENQPMTKLVYSGVVIQKVNNGYQVFGNSQTSAYFKTLTPILNGPRNQIVVQDLTALVATTFESKELVIPYGTLFYTPQEVCQFLMNYGAWLEANGAVFDDQIQNIPVTWNQMCAEFLYWAQSGWIDSSVVTLNPAASKLTIDKESQVVQPLTYNQSNFVLNNNLYPIQNKDLNIFRDGTRFSVTPLNEGDAVAYGQFNLSNIEHGIVFQNKTLFNDTIYNLISGLKQNRIYVRGTKSGEWNGTLFASGFIYNQDNILEWNPELKYTKGSIVKFKNKFFTALQIVQPSQKFKETEWKVTDYDEIQKGLLPNSSTRSYESALYYNTDKANLEQDADLLSFSLIGFRPREYMASADLTDITQVNIYKNLIKQKGTLNAVKAFKGANLPQGGIDYDVYENWAILQGTFGGTLNDNFVQFRLNENNITANPSIVGLTDGNSVEGAQQLIPLYALFNYGRPVNNPNILPLADKENTNKVYTEAGYVNIDDVKMSAYFFSNLPTAVDKNREIVPISQLYAQDYIWLADYQASWQVLTPASIGQVLLVRNNLNNTCVIYFDREHNLNQFDIFSVINFDSAVNGYYVVSDVVNTKQVLVTLTLPNSTKSITGAGIAMKFQSQRVSQPGDIQSLPLLNNEFVKNTVWVDTNTDGEWGVYRKNIVFKYETEFNQLDSEKFGYAVAYSPLSDYLFSDPIQGKVYRYQYDATDGSYEQDEILSGDVSFGTSITHEQNIYVISQPENTPKLFLYTVNDTTVSDNIILYQEITASDIDPSITNFGSATALSGDLNWLYVSDYDQDPSSARNNVQVYRRNNELTDAGSFVVGATYQIVEVGTTEFRDVGAVTNQEGVYFIVSGQGIVTTQNFIVGCSYEIITLGTTTQLEWNTIAGTVSVTYSPGDTITVTSVGTGTSTGTALQLTAGEGTGIARRCDYEFVATITNGLTSIDKFGRSLSTNYYGTTLVVGAPNNDELATNNGKGYIFDRLVQNYEIQDEYTEGVSPDFTLAWAPDVGIPLTVTKNGIEVSDTDYSFSGTTFTYTGIYQIGDILTISGNAFELVQVLDNDLVPRNGTQFGYSVDNNNLATEILVGAPFYISSRNQEGAVFRYTYGGARFGIISGTEDVNVTSTRTILLNGYAVNIQAGDSTQAASNINNAGLTNIQAASVNGKLIISLVNFDLALSSQELLLSADQTTLSELGITLYTQTQLIQNPHSTGPSQFGTVIKFNEQNSVAVSAPVGTRFTQTTFDFIDDEDYTNDTIFDNNSTQFIDTFKNAGAVYTFDYLGNYNESLSNIGNYTYGQSVNAENLFYGSQPRYGTALDWHDDKIVVGSPDYRSEDVDGQVIVYLNDTGEKNWIVLRQPNPTVDINRVYNIQLFDGETNQTLQNLDYFDPLQGKLLGAVQQNIDVISNVDPAGYNNINNPEGIIWGEAQLGTIWFNTSNVRFINYHQDTNSYNARYWGTLFPGSDVAVYSWVSSTVLPSAYQGPGLPLDITKYTVQTVLNSSNTITPVYYFWVRNSGIVFSASGKTLADTNIAAYITNPVSSGISYMAPVNTDAVALYNVKQYMNANDTVLQLGYSTGQQDNPAHQEFTLIRTDFADDFLPGVPGTRGYITPESLYDRLLDSLSGVDETGAVVPNPFLPKAVQSGILARPRQSFFYNRYLAIQNYLQYANTIMALFPITEIRSFNFLNTSGTYYDTKNYWEYVNWWAVGYDNNTKAVLQVPVYADLSTLNVATNTLVTVSQNSNSQTETYRYDGEGVWTRIGLQNGTIRFKDELFDYDAAGYGFGGTFYDTDSFDVYPSEETRWIMRALNEQIYTNELLIYRNKSLILLFEYIQEETIENQNYLPWLNKTSLVDISHKIRELVPLQNYVSDNEEFLEGYVNETKPYHVVIKEFLFDYTGGDIYPGTITDFDVPATYDTTIEKFVSPQLVYQNANTDYEFLPDDPVWQTEKYKEWFTNYGVSLEGQTDYPISKLLSYLTLTSQEIIVDNYQGFPINGTITIGREKISYAYIDRASGIMGGLTRGVEGTQVVDHLPGEVITMNLPGVIVLDGGRNYANPPRVFAQIDTSIYPEPKKEAVLEAVMSLDSVVSVNVIDPGQGYAVTPEIVIDPAQTYSFSGENVNTVTNTIDIYAPELVTGDLIRYIAGTTNIGGLADRQYYYINVLDSSPTTIIALYTSYADALSDNSRVNLLTQGSNDQIFEYGARAVPITSSSPVRENNITLRFDRTSYTPQVTDWVPYTYYGSQFINYNLESSSSNVALASTQPDINYILSSAQGSVFPIFNVTDDEQTDWSSFERIVSAITSDNQIVLTFDNIDNIVGPNGDKFPSGSTVGFYVGMPVKFDGATGTQIVPGTTYYIYEVVDISTFKISTSPNGSVLPLDSIPVTSFKMFTGTVTNTAIITSTYSGYRNVVNTYAGKNTVKVELTPIGTEGTNGLYTNLPVFFIDDPFGGLAPNEIYYVVSVLGPEEFTLSRDPNPVTVRVLQTNAADQIIVENANGLNVNDPIVFDSMAIDFEPVNSFGNIQKQTIYYVKTIGVNVITISETVGGPTFDTGDAIPPSDGNYCIITSQAQVKTLANQFGNATMVVGLPVSPGQVDGQAFTFYPSSENFADISAPDLVYGNLLQKTIKQTMSTENDIAYTTNSSGMYVNIPFTVETDIGGLLSGKTYYVYDLGNIEIYCKSTTGSLCNFDADFTDNTMIVSNISGTGILYPGSLITGTNVQPNTYIVGYISGTGGNGTYEVSTTYFVPVLNESCTSTSGIITVDDEYTTGMIYENMPITFSLQSLGGILINYTYYVRHIIDSEQFTVSSVENEAAVTLTTSNGNMLGTGSPKFKVYLPSTDLVNGDTYNIYEVGTTDWASIGATYVPAPGITAGQTIIINEIGTTPQTEWNSIAGTTGITYEVNDVINVVNSYSLAYPTTGSAYEVEFTATGTETGTGKATVVLTDEAGPVTWTQEITEDPTFDIGYVLGGYNVIINNGGSGFTQNNTITIAGDLLGGTTPDNDLTLTVSRINPIVSGAFSWSLPVESNGSITKVIAAGNPPGASRNYYLKVTGANTFKVYNDPLMQVPVSGVDFSYQGYTQTTIESVGYVSPMSGDDYTDINVADADGLNINDAITFTNLDDEAYIIVEGSTYYIVYKNANIIRVAVNPGDEPIAISSTSVGSTSALVTKAGSFMLLPEPFTFSPSIVKYNNRLWACTISNNDSEFVFGKWEELRSDDRRLNALDRIVGYYQPTVNMPGLDLPQLMTGLEYPNTTYKGNAFEPDQEYPLDTQLVNLPFDPTQVNIPGVTYDGVNYIAPANLPNYAAVAADIEVRDDWYLYKLANQTLSLTDIVRGDDVFIMTSANSPTPIFTSTNKSVWSTNGYLVPFGTPIGQEDFFKIRLIAAGLQLNGITYKDGMYWAVGNRVLSSTDGILWYQRFRFDITNDGLQDVDVVDIDAFSGVVAVGSVDNGPYLITTTDGEFWDQVNGLNNRKFTGVASGFNKIFVVGTDGGIITSSDGSTWSQLQPYPDVDYNAVVFADNTLVIVGNNGVLVVSTDGETFTNVNTGTTENLNNATYVEERGEWTIVGDNNTVLQTLDIKSLPVIWDTTQMFSTPEPDYSVMGDPFQAGYGPEEMVPGIVTDQLTMIVNTRAGTNWPATEYAHVGYNVVSVELPQDITNEYNFNEIVQTPAYITVAVIEDGISTTIYEGADYSIDWINKTVTPVTELTSSQELRIDVYEVGNGEQLVKSSTENDPIERNAVTGFDEINLDCNYTTLGYNGNGIVQPDSYPISVLATETESGNDFITVSDVANFTLNDEINFLGEVFGGVSTNTSYYVKSINTVRSTITISNTLVSGVAGPIFPLSTDAGSMVVVIQKTSGQFWTEPAVLLNGIKLTSGLTNYVIATNQTNVSVVTFSTVGLIVGQPIVFSDTIFGGIIPRQTYYVKEILNATEFLISENPDGTGEVYVTNATGSAIFITNDYAVTLANNQINAKLMFATRYDKDIDYISYSFFGQTEPQQYGFTLPQTQTFLGQGSVGPYYLDNYLGGDNPINAVVEVNGLRVDPSKYTISFAADSLVFDPTVVPTSSDTIAVTTYNDTQRQYLFTNEYTGVQVTPILFVNNAVIPVTVTTTVAHGLSTNDVVRIDGVTGSTQLNNQVFIIEVTSLTEFELYEYISGTPASASVPVTNIDTYNGGGYVWLNNSYILENKYGTESSYNSVTEQWMLNVDEVDGLVVDTPVYFTEDGVELGDATSIPQIIAGQKYFIKDVNELDNTFSISDTQGGAAKILSTTTGISVRITQWQQTNVDRLWVTVNGYRVASSNLRLNAVNEVSILTNVETTDVVVITSMMPSASPDSMTYIQTVNKDGVGKVYRANSETKTWMTENIGEYLDRIQVADVRRLTNSVTQNNTAPVAMFGYHEIGLNANRFDILQCRVYNNNPARLGYIDDDYITVSVSGLGPFVQIQSGEWIEAGDELTITTLSGRTIYVNGEYMTILNVDEENNILNVQRGALGSIINTYIPKYSTVYSLLEDNAMSQINYNSVWNPIPGIYNTTEGDPLQIAETSPARFLRVDIT